MVMRRGDKPHPWKLRGLWCCMYGLSFGKGATAEQAFDLAEIRADHARKVADFLAGRPLLMGGKA